MSIINIVNHDEDIYKILEVPPPPEPNTPRYVSNLERQLKQLKVEEQHRTMGLPETPLNPPSKFLRKGEGLPKPRTPKTRLCGKHGHPPVPKIVEKCDEKKEKRMKVNFRVINIKKVVALQPKSQEPQLVDSNDGHIYSLKNSGEIPQHALRKDFGKVPKYLVKANQKKKEIEESMKKVKTENLCELIGGEERETLLNNLRKKYIHVYNAFIQLPILTDTVSKIIKKNKMEEELRQLESDIALLEKFPYIYVYDDY